MIEEEWYDAKEIYRYTNGLKLTTKTMTKKALTRFYYSDFIFTSPDKSQGLSKITPQYDYMHFAKMVKEKDIVKLEEEFRTKNKEENFKEIAMFSLYFNQLQKLSSIIHRKVSFKEELEHVV